VPGLVFVVPITITNPDLTCEYVLKTHEGLGLNSYGIVAFFFLLAFAIGHSVMLGVTLIQRLFMFIRHGVERDHEVPEKDRKLWALIARRVLSEQYGIDAQEELGQEEWNALYDALAVPTRDDLRVGVIAMLTSEAMGWCGLGAIPLSHGLWNRYYVAWCLILIIAGLFHDWWFAEGFTSARLFGIAKNRAILRELRAARDSIQPQVVRPPE